MWFHFSFLSAAIPDSQVRPAVFGGNPDNEDIKNIIPEPAGTLPPKILQQPFDYEGEVYTGSQTGDKQEDKFPEEEEEEEEVDNQLNRRGDVFSMYAFVLAPVKL